jgi:hypothetical protein
MAGVGFFKPKTAKSDTFKRLLPLCAFVMHSLWRICLRLWKHMWNLFCESQFVEGLSHKTCCFNPLFRLFYIVYCILTWNIMLKRQQIDGNFAETGRLLTWACQRIIPNSMSVPSSLIFISIYLKYSHQ